MLPTRMAKTPRYADEADLECRLEGEDAPEFQVKRMNEEGEESVDHQLHADLKRSGRHFQTIVEHGLAGNGSEYRSFWNWHWTERPIPTAVARIPG